jgi:hypothetical protein
MSRREGKTTEAVLQVYQQLVPVQPTTLKVFNFSTKPKKKLVSSFQNHLLNPRRCISCCKGHSLTLAYPSTVNCILDKQNAELIAIS